MSYTCRVLRHTHNLHMTMTLEQSAVRPLTAGLAIQNGLEF